MVELAIVFTINIFDFVVKTTMFSIPQWAYCTFYNIVYKNNSIIVKSHDNYYMSFVRNNL